MPPMINGYLVRIELPGDQSGELYKRLHLEMGKKDFMRWFLSDLEPGKFEMPHATYLHEGLSIYKSVQEAYQAAYLAASAVDPQARIIALEKGQAVYSPGFIRIGQK